MTPNFHLRNATLRPLAFIKTIHVMRTRPAIYVNNAKVACSTIKLALQRAELGDPKYKPKPSVHSHETSPLLTWPDLEVADLVERLRDHFTFSFVRCPYARLQSAYANKIVRPQKKGSFRIEAGFDPEEVPSFAEFVAAITTQVPKKHNPHWRAQWINLSVDAISYDFIGRLEQFSDDWQIVADRLSLPPSPQRAGKVSDRSIAVYTDEAAEMTRTFYARDFEEFGYDPDPSRYLAP